MPDYDDQVLIVVAGGIGRSLSWGGPRPGVGGDLAMRN
jgi:hypothetical protein